MIERHPGVTYVALVPNDTGARRAIAAAADEIAVLVSASESHNQSNVNRSVAESLEGVTAIAGLFREAGLPWTSLGRYELRARGPGVVVPMDMLRDITASGVVGDATRARRELGERMVEAVVPRIVQVCKEIAGKE